MFIGLILIGLVVYLVIKSSQNPQQNPLSHTTANSDQSLRILNDRYARGEIQEEEYLRIKAELRR